MRAKQLFIIACSAFLLAVSGSALAANNASDTGNQISDSGSSATMSQATQNQTETETRESNNDMQAETVGQSSEESASKNPENQRGDVIGKLVDNSGQIQGYVVRVGETGVEGTPRYVVVPRGNNQTAVNTTSQNMSMASSGTATTQDKPLLHRMYRALQKQAKQIRLLKEQLAEQRQAGSQGNSLAGNMVQRPVDQIAHIIVNRQGKVEAIVLNTGVVLASDEWVNMMENRVDSGSRRITAAGMAGANNGGNHTGQRRHAIIIFQPGS